MVKKIKNKIIFLFCIILPFYMNRITVYASQYDFLTQDNTTTFDNVEKAIKQEGAGVIELVFTGAVVSLLLSILFVGLSFIFKSSDVRGRTENKERLSAVFISGAGIFGIFSFVGALYLIGMNFRIT